MLLNRAKVSTITTGTGTVSLGLLVSPYQTWAAAGAVDGAVVSYLIEDGSAWEIGRGVYSAGADTVTRPGPGVDGSFDSSTGALLVLSGTATIASVAIAADFNAISQVGSASLAAVSYIDSAIITQNNISSITNISTGTYQINFINPMSNTNYAVLGSGYYDASGDNSTVYFGICRDNTLSAWGKNINYVVVVFYDISGTPANCNFDLVIQPTDFVVGPWDFSPPLSAYFDTLWSGTGTNIALIDDKEVGLLFDGGPPVNGDIGAYAYKTLPSPSMAWSAKVKMKAILSTSNYSVYGISCKSTANNKLNIWGPSNSIGVLKWLRLTTTGYVAEDDLGLAIMPEWFRLDYDGSATLSAYVSMNGKNWVLVATHAVSDWPGAAPDKVGFGIDYNHTGGPNTVGEVSYWSLTGGGL